VGIKIRNKILKKEFEIKLKGAYKDEELRRFRSNIWIGNKPSEV
jgi:hypothetical protein